MLIIRPTVKLAKKIGAMPLQLAESGPNPLLDWHGNLFTFERTQHILLVNTSTFYAVCLYGRGCSDVSRFTPAFFGQLKSQMKGDALEDRFSRLASQAHPVVYAKTSDRAAVGILVECIKMAPYILHDQAPHVLAEVVNSTIWAPLGYKTPRECMERLALR